MLLCCYEVWSENAAFSEIQAIERIEKMQAEKARELRLLYNPFRNISLNQSLGGNDVPISEWMLLSDWREWD